MASITIRGEGDLFNLGFCFLKQPVAMGAQSLAAFIDLDGFFQRYIAMLKAAVCTDYDAEIPLSERPRPPQMWSGAHFEGKPVGFVREYHGYSLGDYEAEQLLPDEAEIQDGTRVYLVTG